MTTLLALGAIALGVFAFLFGCLVLYIAYKVWDWRNIYERGLQASEGQKERGERLADTKPPHDLPPDEPSELEDTAPIALPNLDDTDEWAFDLSVLEDEPMPQAFQEFFFEFWAQANTSNVENYLRWEWELNNPERSEE